MVTVKKNKPGGSFRNAVLVDETLHIYLIVDAYGKYTIFLNFIKI